jgi:hypothetical protein
LAFRSLLQLSLAPVNRLQEALPKAVQPLRWAAACERQEQFIGVGEDVRGGGSVMGFPLVPIVAQLPANDERASMQGALNDDYVVMGSRGSFSVL